MENQAIEKEWRVVRARENISAQTIERFRRGLPIRNASLARIVRAAEALDMKHLLRAEST